MGIVIKAIELIAGSIVVALQFAKDPSQYRWYVIGLLAVVFACSVSLHFIENIRRKKWEAGQVERDRNLVRQTVQELKPTQSPMETVVPVPVVPPTPVPKPVEILPSDPRVYPCSIKETKDALFHRTLFVLANRGGDVAHKVNIDMIWKIKGKNVSFPEVEAIPVGQESDFLPTIEGEPLMTKHDIFRLLLDDWNANSGSMVDRWPKEMNVRWQSYNGEKFVCAVTLVFHPIEYLLRRNTDWSARNFIMSEFKKFRFARELTVHSG
ncbi:MAG: hypothetical protein ABSA27_19930 [Terriglobales bacterium]